MISTTVAHDLKSVIHKNKNEFKAPWPARFLFNNEDYLLILKGLYLDISITYFYEYLQGFSFILTRNHRRWEVLCDYQTKAGKYKKYILKWSPLSGLPVSIYTRSRSYILYV